jgi:myo-inositol-1(or 4)-monophosphatase
MRDGTVDGEGAARGTDPEDGRDPSRAPGPQAHGHDLASFLITAIAAARAGAEVLAAHAGQVGVGEWEGKRPSDFVTYVDREAEQAVLGVLRSAHPDHAVLAEEGTEGTALAGGGDPRALLEQADGPMWVVDPLDGTTNYLHGFPAYAVSVAVCVEGLPVAGAVVDAAGGSIWEARLGGGARRNGRPISVSEIASLEHALLGTGFPFKAPDRIPEHFRILDAALRSTSGVRRAGSAALDLCWLADGRLDGFFELELAPWDIAAGLLMVREAGGVATDFDGDDRVTGAAGVLAGNPTIHPLLASLVRSAAP